MMKKETAMHVRQLLVFVFLSVVLGTTGRAWAMYDSQLGRWMTRDPLGYVGGSNLYGICGDNPIQRLDPLGLRSTCDNTVAQCLLNPAINNLWSAVKACWAGRGLPPPPLHCCPTGVGGCSGVGTCAVTNMTTGEICI